MNAPMKQRGVALIIALLVVALAVILIAGLLDRGELSGSRVRNQLREQQAQAYAQGLEDYAARVLLKAAADANYDANTSPWAVPLPPTKVPGGQIVASMRDRNGCFNLNNLALPTSGEKWKERFKSLLRALKLDVSLADAVNNWINAGATTSDDQFYLQQDVPYRRAAQGFVHVSELRLVKGVTADVYARLAPEVCALPPGTRINVNTASVAVLMSLDDTVTEQVAKTLWQDGRASFQDTSQVFTTVPSLQAACSSSQLCPISAQSNYFLARGDITLDGLPFSYFSLIERGQAGIRVIERSRGADL